MTDRDPAAVTVGMPLEMTFRRLYSAGGIHNYWWKCQPVRCN
jgi:hydroxymethylglutaryl-CoA synthase